MAGIFCATSNASHHASARHESKKREEEHHHHHEKKSNDWGVGDSFVSPISAGAVDGSGAPSVSGGTGGGGQSAPEMSTSAPPTPAPDAAAPQAPVHPSMKKKIKYGAEAFIIQVKKMVDTIKKHRRSKKQVAQNHKPTVNNSEYSQRQRR